MCVYVCMCVPSEYRCPWRPREGIRSARTGVINNSNKWERKEGTDETAGQLHTHLLLSIYMHHSNWLIFLKAMLLQTSLLSDELLDTDTGSSFCSSQTPINIVTVAVAKENLWPGALQTVDFFFLIRRFCHFLLIFKFEFPYSWLSSGSEV